MPYLVRSDKGGEVNMYKSGVECEYRNDIPPSGICFNEEICHKFDEKLLCPKRDWLMRGNGFECF